MSPTLESLLQLLPRKTHWEHWQLSPTLGGIGARVGTAELGGRWGGPGWLWLGVPDLPCVTQPPHPAGSRAATT